MSPPPRTSALKKPSPTAVAGRDRATWRADPEGAAYARMRTDVVRAAEQAINEAGIAGMRIGRVAELAGCTRQNLYRYFDSKDDLINAVLLRRSERLGRYLVRRRSSAAPEERIIDGILEAVRVARADPYFQSYYDSASAAKMTGFIASSSALLSAVAPFLDEFAAENKGSLRSDISREELAEWLFRVFLAELLASDASGRTRAQRAAYLRKMVIPTLTGKLPRRRPQG